MATETIDIPLSEVIVGEQIRKDLGDLTELQSSMDGIGQLQPIGVLCGNVLLCGARRLEVAKRLGWRTIRAAVLHTAKDAVARITDDRLCGVCEVEFTPTELVRFVRWTERVFAETGWVYFVSAKGLDLIKIGWTANIERRLSQLIGASPVELTLVEKWAGTRFDESDYHTQWEHLREHGEWFRTEPELIRWIAREGVVRNGK